jgi:ATP-dependent DNA ligase
MGTDLVACLAARIDGRATSTRASTLSCTSLATRFGIRSNYAAKVRNGFVPQLRRDVATEFKGLRIEACPFANLPERKRTQWALTKEEMKNCVWLKPEVVAQVEFTEWTPDGHLRHSKFVGLREDKAAREVVREVEVSYDAEALPGLAVGQ